MDVVQLSGINKKPANLVTLDRLKARLKVVKPSSFAAHLISNEIARIEGTAPRQRFAANNNGYETFLMQRLSLYPSDGLVPQLIKKELALIQAGNFSGTTAGNISGIGKKKKGLFKKLAKGLKKFGKLNKKLALAPSRMAALALIALNFRGLAFKMQRAPVDKLKKKWERLGGNPKKLFNTIAKGAKKKPLLGSKLKKAVKGLNEAIQQDPVLINGIGIEPVSTGSAAMMALAAPIIAAIIALVKKKPGEKPGVDPDTGEILEKAASGESKSAIESITDMVTTVAAAAGKPTSLPPGESYAVSDVEEGASKSAGLPTGDEEIDDTPQKSGFAISPVMIGAAALGLFLIMKKK